MLTDGGQVPYEQVRVWISGFADLWHVEISVIVYGDGIDIWLRRQEDITEMIEGGKSVTIDIEALREDLKQECHGAFFGGGFGGALIESFDIERASLEELAEIAEKKGVDLKDYQI